VSDLPPSGEIAVARPDIVSMLLPSIHPVKPLLVHSLSSLSAFFLRFLDEGPADASTAASISPFSSKPPRQSVALAIQVVQAPFSA